MGGIFIGQSWFILELYTPKEKEFPYEYTEFCTSSVKQDVERVVNECESSVFENKAEVIHIECEEYYNYRRDE